MASGATNPPRARAAGRGAAHALCCLPGGPLALPLLGQSDCAFTICVREELLALRPEGGPPLTSKHSNKVCVPLAEGAKAY